uniref:Putative secreted protein n=1 Tax=Anopheles marajoara TaxID=58244 RepID=A0A2M4CCY8_9DIPT
MYSIVFLFLGRWVDGWMATHFVATAARTSGGTPKAIAAIEEAHGGSVARQRRDDERRWRVRTGAVVALVVMVRTT